MENRFRGIFSDATRYWEIRRVPYNFVLAGIVVIWLVSTWPHFRPALTLRSMVLVLILAVLANVCYCSAYLVDIALQFSGFHDTWRRWRLVLWLAGIFVAVVIANYWIADEIYPFVSP